MRPLLALLLLSGCVDARSGAGAECARNSQCAAPLVCALQHCRNECNSSRDCPIGAACLRSEAGFGVCQLERETACSGDGACVEPLVCRFGACTNECVDVACVPGATCRDGACFDPATMVCESDLDCPGLACIDGRCLVVCLSGRDCRFGSDCIEGSCVPSDFDAGPQDSGEAPDGGSDGAVDATPPFCDPSVLDVIDLDVGEAFACALVEDGSVWCWGSNGAGQLGNPALAVGSTTTASAVRVAEVDDAVAIATGHSHACALLADRTVVCWGDHTRGQCGVGAPTENVRSPRAVVSSEGFSELALGGFASCALDGDIVSCFGSRSGGALADGSTSGIADVPVLATEVGPTRALDYEHAGGAALLADGSVFTWGDSALGVTNSTYDTPSFVDSVAIVMGEAHACLLRPEGQVYCAGDNSVGQLGDPARGASDPSFGLVGGLTGITQLSATSSNTCARSGEGDVHCWGANLNGSLGLGDTLQRSEPERVDLPGPAAHIAVGRAFSCAIVGGRVYCWGSSVSGGLGLFPPPPNPYLVSRPVECLP